jgi:anaerobic ribonucleoside-triphosphate reductase activating protein
LLYTGYPAHSLEKRLGETIHVFDAIVAGPYDQNLPSAALRGSNNQTLILLSPIARKRYETSDEENQRLQVRWDGKTLWIIGIPRPGDLERLRTTLREQGIHLGDLSWHR